MKISILAPHNWNTPYRVQFLISALLVAVLMWALTPNSQAQTKTDASSTTTAKRMVVMFAPDAIARQSVRDTDKIETLIGDERYQVNRKLWGAVSLRTASVLRDVENKFQIKATLAFGQTNHGFAAALTPEQVAALKADLRIADVFEDVQGAPAWADSPTNTPALSDTYVRGWNLLAIGLTDSGSGPTADLWSPSSDYRNYRDNTYPVRAYVIDSAIGFHGDLNFIETDSVNFDCDTTQGASCVDPGQYGPDRYATQNSCDTHATHVAGVLGARRQYPTAFGVEGVAPNAQLTSVRVMNGCPSSDGGVYSSGLIAALNWLAANVPNNGVDEYGKRRLSGVANISILWPLDPLGQTRPVLSAAAATAMRNAVWGAVDAGVFFSFAAGNSNEPASNIYPAAIGAMTDGAMAVGAIQSNGTAMDDTAPPVLGNKMASYGTSVEIWAPGQDVQSTAVYLAGSLQWLQYPWGVGPATLPFTYGQQYYALQTGSSLAAPHVAGAALLVARKFQKAGLPCRRLQALNGLFRTHVKII